MADLKISQLTGATTPLAGTEILPIVQSGSTVKVSVNNLTAGKEVPASKVTIATGSDALSIYIKGRSSDNQSNIFFVNAADSAQYGYINANASEMVVSSIGARPLSLGASGATAFQISTAGNLVPVTAGKGIDFSANTPAAGMTSQLLNWYEEGTWTPATTAAGATYVVQTGQYVKVGKVITCTANIQWSAHTNAGANLQISGLPYASSSSATYPSGTISGNLIIATDHSIQTYIIPSTSTITFLDCTDTTGGSTSYAIPASANISINYTYITG